MTSTTDPFGRETMQSEILAGRGKRFLVTASDDCVMDGTQWHVRLWELRAERGREVHDLRMCTKAADRDAAVILADQVIAKVKQQLNA